MSAPSSLLLLDTCVVLHVIRGSPVAGKIDHEVNLRDRPERPLISAVSAGEALAFAERNSWGSQKKERLRQLLSDLVIVDISSEQVLSSYAAIDTFQKKSGLNLGQNDVWIAATARAADACLVTTDKDFDPLDGRFLTRFWVDPNTKAAAVQ